MGQFGKLFRYSVKDFYFQRFLQGRYLSPSSMYLDCADGYKGLE